MTLSALRTLTLRGMVAGRLTAQRMHLDRCIAQTTILRYVSIYIFIHSYNIVLNFVILYD